MGAKYAIMNAGGGFVYVGAMYGSFPHALEVSKKGYHAFALIYRPDSAYEDLARAMMRLHFGRHSLKADVKKAQDKMLTFGYLRKFNGNIHKKMVD